ncbi:MAG: pantoate--beta-alanine ligase [Desulfobacteraceae bacterium IS3]|nr:MAG: pantoate--beta-alanine ligase [Desulfobacteraceae bacterium IS3]
MEIIRTVKNMQTRSDSLRCNGKKIVLVPTMGFLHEGHISLIRKGRELGDDLVVSIFVNPAQFAPEEDFDSYPRGFEKDCQLTEKAGVNAIFAPDAKELYAEGFQTYIRLEKLPMHLCGLSRPVFFRGVATVVSKLFNIVKPHIAIFGEKDFQQLQVIRQMVKDLNFDIEIVGGALVREPDGLAMSSRNTYLTPEQRVQALCLYQSLKKAQERVNSGIRESSKIIEEASAFISSLPEAVIDYAALCDPETLENVKTVDKPTLMALAVKIGKTRLIDNMMLR